jgi:hypothetical protein
VVIAVFANIYYNTYVKPSVVTLASLLTSVEGLSPELKVEFYKAMGNILEGEGLIK